MTATDPAAELRAACDRCHQPKPLTALFAFTYGPQPWDPTERRAILCVPCHGAATELAERIDELAALAVDITTDPRENHALDTARAEAVLLGFTTPVED